MGGNFSCSFGFAAELLKQKGTAVRADSCLITLLLCSTLWSITESDKNACINCINLSISVEIS